MGPCRTGAGRPRPPPALAPAHACVDRPSRAHGAAEPALNRILLDPDDQVADALYRLPAAATAHVQEVLRAEPGRRLRVGLIDGPRGSGQVVASSRGETLLECVLDEPPSARPRTDLVLCVPRPKSLRKLLPQVTALGVDRIVLLRSWRVEPAYLEAQALTAQRLRALLLDGLVQSGETALPRVFIEPRFRPFVEDRLPSMANGARRALLDPRAPQSLAAWAGALDGDQRVIVVIGPEGGLIDFEVSLLESAGFVRHQLGSGILRVETACVAALAQIELLRALGAPTKVSHKIDR